MSERPSHNLSGLDVDQARRIDALCRQFEADWRAGARPSLDNYLVEVPDQVQPALRAELEALERELRQSEETVARGEPVAVAEAPTVAPAEPPTHPTPGEARLSIQQDVTVAPGEDATLDHGPSSKAHATDASLRRVRYFGDYEILREIARGGMGVVFQARQVSLNRPVALKMILAGQLANETDVKRFHTEAEAAANLDHPGIVQIYEVGQLEGQHYFSMGYVEGQSLSHRLADGPLPPRESSELIRRVSEAIEYAHQHGVIHRDLKPANILLDKNANPRVTDFGLAKKLEADSGLTGSGQIMGTPSYMPPEQTGGKRGELGPAADVYALGATLYALVTGRPPFQAATAMDTVIQVLSDEPVPPRRLNRSIPRDLETIALKCLKKNPSRRYKSAQELADDLGRWLRGEPITARPIWLRERVFKWVRRRPAVAATLVLGLVAALALVGTALQSNAASNVRLLAESRRYDSQINQASLAWETSGVERVELILQECEPRLRGWEWKYMKRRGHLDLHTLSSQGGKGLVDLALSPDGFLIAAADHYDVQIWDIRAQKPRAQRLHHAQVSSIAFSPDGSRLVSAADDLKLLLWDMVTFRQVREFRWPKRSNPKTEATPATASVAFRPDGRQLAAACGDEIILWDVPSGEALPKHLSHSGRITNLVYSPDGKRLASVGLDRKARVWDAAAGRELRAFTVKDPGRLAFSPDGSQLAVTGPLRVWSLSDGTETAIIKGHASHESAIAWSSDGMRLATSSDDQTLRVWDIKSGNELLRLKGHKAAVTDVTFCPSGDHLFSCGEDGAIKHWDATRKRELVAVGPTVADPDMPRRRSGRVSFSPDGNTLATPQDAQTIALWNPEDGKLIRSFGVSNGPIRALAFSPDGSQIATIGTRTQPGLWDMVTGQSMVTSSTVSENSSGRGEAVFSPDRLRFASFGDEHGLSVWDARSGKKLATLVLDDSGFSTYVMALAYSPDGRRIASSQYGLGNSICMWDAASYRQLWRQVTHGGDDALAFSPDGRFLATGGDLIIDIRDADSGEVVQSLPGFPRGVCGLAYSPDGRRIASASRDGAVRVWDSISGQELITLDGEGELLSVTFSPDGRRIASLGDDRWVRIWDSGG
jgi:WD40 repeat protein